MFCCYCSSCPRIGIMDTTAKSLFPCAPVSCCLLLSSPRIKAGSRCKLLHIPSSPLDFTCFFFLFNLSFFCATITLLPIDSSDTSRPSVDVVRACLACEPFWPEVEQLAPGELHANCTQAVTTTVNEIEHQPSCFLLFFFFLPKLGSGLSEVLRWRAVWKMVVFTVLLEIQESFKRWILLANQANNVQVFGLK